MKNKYDSCTSISHKWQILIIACTILSVHVVTSFSTPPPSSNYGGDKGKADDGPDDNGYHGILFSSVAVGSLATSSSSSTSTPPTLYTSTKSSNSGISSSTPPTPSADQITKNSQSLLRSTLTFWTNLINPKKRQREQNKSSTPQMSEAESAEYAKLQTMKIKKLIAPNSTILSDPLLQHAGHQSRLIGNPLSTSGVQHLAKILSQHYHRMGYPLCSVTGATLSLDGVLGVQIEEPKLFNPPVDIAFAKEMILAEDGTTVSFKQYKELLEAQQSNSGGSSSQRHRSLRKLFKPSQLSSSVDNIKRSDLNTTFVQTTGKTRPHAIAKAIGLSQGEVFQWDASKWRNVVKSGIWDKVLNVEPVRLKDGSVQLQVICQESNRRRVEYGITKSLYTGAWEGELDFENRNLFGGGEVVSIAVKRGARDPEPSVQLRFQDDKFGLPHGYSIEAFQDYIGPEKYGASTEDTSESINENGIINNSNSNNGSNNDETNPLLTRKGITVRLSTPIPQSILQRNAISASLERTKSRIGEQESIASTTLNLGPYLPNQNNYGRDIFTTTRPRHSLLTTITTGTRLLPSAILRPYTAGTILARNIFPLNNPASSTTTATNPTTTSSSLVPTSPPPLLKPIQLAFRHSITSSTANIPRHEANAAGISARVRGYPSGSNGAISSCIVGTTELRIPFRIQKLRIGTGAIVFFADWLVAQSKTHFTAAESASTIAGSDANDEIARGGSSQLSMPIFQKASVGLGLRKSFQGIPVKYDLSLTQDGKVGAFFGMGHDFDVI